VTCLSLHASWWLHSSAHSSRHLKIDKSNFYSNVPS
jgi:hypothetical protein